MKSRIVFLFLIITLFTACNGDMVYSRYADISIAGWERSDSVIFNSSPIKESGTYEMVLGIRTNNSFPFKKLVVIVEQTVYPKQTVYCDTASCQLYDDKGQMLGNGISSHQYIYNVAQHHYQQGDSIRVYIRHDMKREIMPGVESVGIEIRKPTECTR